MKITRLQRILRLITVLQAGQAKSPTQIAEEMGVSRRTVFRDMRMLQEAGIPWVFDEERNGYRLDENFFLPPLNLKLPEALSLLVLAYQLGENHGLPLQRQAREAAMKIESILPAAIRQQCGPLLESISVHLPARARHDGLETTFSCLQQALRRRNKVQLKYISLHEQKLIATTLSPYHLLYAQRAWYVIGHSSAHAEVRIFKLGRIKELVVLPSVYLLDKPFELESFLGNAWGMIPEGRLYEVKLRFESRVAPNVAEVLWHKTQKCCWENDGRLIYQATVDGLGEIAWWILGYGDQVEVLEPRELRERVGDFAGKMWQIYQNHR